MKILFNEYMNLSTDTKLTKWSLHLKTNGFGGCVCVFDFGFKMIFMH